MVYSTVGYCACGFQVWIEYLVSSDRTWTYRFFDDEHREIDRCPQCGRRLSEDLLESL
ncbi:hypothetical protein SAMN02746041_01160 [Desulfacinum hydrothermale DSM 13146]|uniref:Uncharacterized protein n=1 Tax=Desulfacinum hydrothermale DSM 13146 TaxID=1121390 RepID=A0A1W1XBG1_9BACT|nr:hypothetical protein [Desulfacinum hydrothermale]SMC21276.1 hypothetical protein SAMN02746041_01160 [Desulfacinum hydrothermale DSM 13146]